MPMDSCDHDDYIVVYEISYKIKKCPVCDLIEENGDEIKDLKSQVENLQE